MKTIVYVLGVLFLGLAGSQMQAGPLITVTSPGTVYPGAQYTLGFEFHALTNVVVTALGTFDSGNGLSTSVPVGIWDTSGNLLDSATVPAGSAGTLDGYFRYTAIVPFVLTAGTNYVIGSYYPGNSSSYNTHQSGSGSVDPEFVIVVD
ncbi:MAG TPA: DUF4082 domain-containing protein, partial [Bryobacteraceae bacterium]|nr:DUF4082 domain-containing protein [Bryobacteraceae bacterium]